MLLENINEQNKKRVNKPVLSVGFALYEKKINLTSR